MEQFNYLAVLISIILGLGMTQLLSGFGRWIEHRATFRAYAPSICWALILLVVHVQTWWSMFGLRTVQDWTFLKFQIVLLQPIILYLLATVVLPGAGAVHLDLRASYHAQRQWFFGLLMALLATSVLKDLALDGQLPEATNLGFHILLFMLALTGACTAHPAFHQFLAYSSVFCVGAYIWLLFTRLV